MSGVRARGADVNGGGRQSPYLMEQMLLGVVGECVCSAQRGIGGDGGVDLGSQAVTDPANAKIPHLTDA